MVFNINKQTKERVMSQSKKEVLSLEQKWIGFSNAISKASLNGFEGFLAGEGDFAAFPAG